MPVTQFADTAGIARPTLSQILSGRNKKVSNELIAKLHAAYPDLNVLWLLFGDGDMLNATNMRTSGAENVQNTLFSASQSSGREEDMFHTSGNQRQQDSVQTMRGASSPELSGAITAGFVPSTPQSAFQALGASDAAAEGTSDPMKRVQSIMVFYTDNSYEIFTPAK